MWFFLFSTAHGSSALPVPLPSTRTFVSLLVLRPFVLDLSIYNSDVDPGLFDGGRLYGTVMIFAQVDAQLGIEEEKLFVCSVPAFSATSLTASRAVQPSKMSVCSGAQQYTLHQQKFPRPHIWVF